jgi:hypothetical protein
MPYDPALLAEGVLGKDAEEWLNTELGKTVLGLAELEAQEALQELKTVKPWRWLRIRELQNTVWRAESFQSYLSQLIIRGRQAILSMEQMDAETRE